MKIYKMLLITVAIVLISGCTVPTNEISNPVNNTYEIRNIHTGFVNGETVIVVEYYDQYNIKMVDNRDMNYVDPVRRNTIDIIRTNANTSTLHQFYESNRPPFGRYTIFISDNMTIEGLNSNTPHGGRLDELTSLN